MIIESVPNVSEGRRAAVLDALAGAVRGTAGVTLLDHSADAAHNRSVFTLAGGAAPVEAAILSMVTIAVQSIDLRTHRGEHPRIGAIDVIPFVPLRGASMDDCVALAERTAAVVAQRFGVPVFLYEAAARSPLRRHLEDIRRGGFEGLAEKMRRPEWVPDFGPRAPHPTAGATVIGARMPLVAYNVNLATNQIDLARRIAARIRQRGGGLPGVKALGLTIADRGVVQVSMNLTDYTKTSMPVAFEAVRRLAAEHGVEVLESELIGLVPEGALAGCSAQALKLRDFDDSRILERRI
jgi:glutamate formiminotransferase